MSKGAPGVVKAVLIARVASLPLSEGIIVLEALFDYAAPDEIADGMRKLGLDVNKVKYAVISHAHGDHDGGAPPV